MRETTPFNVCLRLGSEEYTVRFASLPVMHATLGNFEAELMNAVPIKYQELVRLNFSAGYKLRIRRLLHTATAVFDSEEPTDREAVFYAFLNCVFREANVTVVW
jgi:hypothetical protein